MLPNFAKIGRTFPEIWAIFGFQDGGRPPSWICFTRVGTTHEEHLVVFVTMQNLVVIGAVTSIVAYANLNILHVKLENAYSRPPKKVTQVLNHNTCFSRVRPDHPRCRSATWICMCGHTRNLVIYSKFHRNPFRVFGALLGQNLAFPITLAIRFYNSLYYKPWSRYKSVSVFFAPFLKYRPCSAERIPFPLPLPQWWRTADLLQFRQDYWHEKTLVHMILHRLIVT